MGVVIALGILSMVVPPFKSYWEGMFGEIGKWHAGRLRLRLEGRRARKLSQSAGRRESHERRVLASREPPIGGHDAATRTLLDRAAAAVVVVGRGAEQMLEGGRARAMCAVGLAPCIVCPDEALNLPQEIESAVDAAAADVRAGRAEMVVVLLRVPLSGSWFGDVGLDLARIVSTIFKHDDCAVCLEYEEPIDVSPWPDEVFLETPEHAEAILERLVAAGLTEIGQSPPVVIGRAIRLNAELAARALLILTSAAGRGVVTPALVPASSDRPQYASYVALAVRSVTSWEGGITRDATAAVEIQRVMQEQGIHLTAPGSGGRLLPLTPYRGRVIARRPATRADGGRLVDELEAPDTGQGVALLEGAIDTGDSSAAALALATFGRAWIETADRRQRLGLLRRVRAQFDETSEPALWARYLMALDASLRDGDAAPHWFDDDACENAAAYDGLGLLFSAEQMEFARVRGDLDTAVRLAAGLIERLDGPVEPGGVGQTYARATARFVLGNVLRHGGRYDLARSFVAAAQDAYDPSVPSQAVELTHCRYALAVCDAIDGVPRVEPLSGVPTGQIMFARALVTLANSQAAWFVGDLERALEFARDAETAFRSIGYDRHAERASVVAAMFTLWDALNRGEVPRLRESPLLRHAQESLIATTEKLDLSTIRPSAALAVLHFGATFSETPQAPREIALPPMIVERENRRLQLIVPPTAFCIAEADIRLREGLGVGPTRTVPLLPD